MPANLARGQREVKDIIDAAEVQGWTRREPTGQNAHLYLVPPNGGPPVGVSSSPSDSNYRWQILRRMRKSGCFTWPPPKKIKIKIEEDAMLTEVIDAAVDQGWTVDKESKVVTFIPPDQNKPRIKLDAKGEAIGFHDLRNLKRVGLIWPWTPPARPPQVEEEREVEVPHVDLVLEVWREIDYTVDHEISNAGRCRKISTGKLLPIYGSNAGSFVKLNDGQGRIRERNINVLVRSHFGHPPLKNVALTDEPMGHRTADLTALLQDSDLTSEVGQDNQEKKVEEVVQPLVETPDYTQVELEDGWTWIKWIPEVIDGYAISVLGEVRGPDGKPRSPNSIPTGPSGNLWVTMRRFDEPGKTKSVRLDRLMLNGFVGAPPFSGASPIHRDGNKKNCALENLEWPASLEVGEEPPVPHAVPDEVSEPVEPEPQVDKIEEFLAMEVEEATAKVEAYEEFKEAETEELDSGQQDSEQRAYEAQEEEDVDVVDVPVEAKGIEQLVAEGIDDYTAPEPKPRRAYKRKSRAKARVAPKSTPTPKRTAPSAEIRSGKFWEHVGTGQIMYVYDDGVPEFPQATTPEEGKVLLKLAALAQEWVSVILK